MREPQKKDAVNHFICDVRSVSFSQSAGQKGLKHTQKCSAVLQRPCTLQKQIVEHLVALAGETGSKAVSTENCRQFAAA
jgi:hypothetical protein